MRLRACPGTTVEDANDAHEKVKSNGKLYPFDKQRGSLVKTTTLQRVELVPNIATAYRHAAPKRTDKGEAVKLGRVFVDLAGR